MRIITKVTRNRNLLKNLILRDLKRRYVGSFGGLLWSIVHPLALLVSYTFVFSVVFGQRLNSTDGTDSVPIFIFCGILPWTLFQGTVIRCCGVIVEHTSLITKTVMPAEILPISIMLSELVHHAIGVFLLLVVLLFFYTVPASAFAILVYLPILLLFTQGLGWIVAGLQVFLRDTIQALQIVMFLWWCFTPVFYSLERLPQNYRYAVALNPLSIIVTGYRNSLLGLPQPDPLLTAAATAVSLAVFTIGALMFRQAKPAFADVL